MHAEHNIVLAIPSGCPNSAVSAHIVTLFYGLVWAAF